MSVRQKDTEGTEDRGTSNEREKGERKGTAAVVVSLSSPTRKGQPHHANATASSGVPPGNTADHAKTR